MNTGVFPFVLIPLLVYTYFWINPTALAAFLEGLSRYIVEVYLGFKAWKVERETRKAYKYYLRQSEKLAREKGLSKNIVSKYIQKYRDEDWNFLYQREKEEFETRNRDLEDELRDLIAF